MSSRQLDLINAMIATMGEAPLLDADDGHPYVATAKTVIKTAHRELLGRGWWFNTETRNLDPDQNGFVTLPGDALQLDPTRHPGLQPRGRRLYDVHLGSYVISVNPIPARMFSFVALEDLPEVFYNVLMHECEVRFQTLFDGDPQKVEATTKVRDIAMLYLRAEHTRCIKANIHRRPGVQYGMMMAGPGGGSRLPLY